MKAKALLFVVALLFAGGVSAEITGMQTSPGGTNGSVQYNKRGSLQGDTNLTYSTTTRTFAAPYFNLSNSTASKVAVTDGSKNVVASTVSSTELTQLGGISSNVQTQIDSINSTGLTHVTYSSGSASYLGASSSTLTELSKSSANVSYVGISSLTASNGILTISSAAVSYTAISSAVVTSATKTWTADQTFPRIVASTITATNSVGTTSASTATVGSIGEYQTQQLARSSGITATNNIARSISTMTLTAGDWEVSFCGGFKGGGTTSTDQVTALSTTADTLPAIDTTAVPDSNAQTRIESPVNIGNNDVVLCSKSIRVLLSGSRTYYLVSQCTFSAGSTLLYGSITARRAR